MKFYNTSWDANSTRIDGVLYGRCISGCRAFALLTDSIDHYSIAMCTAPFRMFLYVVFTCIHVFLWLP